MRRTEDLVRTLDGLRSVTLQYSIHDSSSHSGKYVPENILTDNPEDKTSRWSGISGTSGFRQRQWITLKLDRPAILKEIDFGKCAPRHPCNLKEFKVFVGLENDHMKEVLHSGLINDAVPEAFSVKYENSHGLILPCRYIKIVPIAAHSADYNTSIWFVALKGINNEAALSRVVAEYTKYREDQSLRLIAKHLRSRQLPYEDLLSQKGARLEHPTISQLYDAIVRRGDFDEAETLVRQAGETDHLFNTYISASQPLAVWKLWLPISSHSRFPSPRSGHAMALDTINQKIYLFGGYSGTQSLSDLWAFDIRLGEWELVQPDASVGAGPKGRSCHAMVYDPGSRCLYMMGKLMDTPTAPDTTPTVFKSEFWRYTIGTSTVPGRWFLLSADTKLEGGPQLLFDHNMVIDTTHGVIVVFGGKIVDQEFGRTTLGRPKLSGMYTYQISKNKWTLEFEDPTPQTTKAQLYIPSRVGHGMAFDEVTRKVYVFGGYRTVRNIKQYMSDMWVYSLATREVAEIGSDCSARGGPDPGFAQRMMIDSNLREVYIMTGLTKDQVTAHESVRRTMWIFNLDRKQWSRATEEEIDDAQAMDIDDEEEPRPRVPLPRFAHQTVYDAGRKMFFMFGGNDGVHEEGRLGDFWDLRLQRPKLEEIMRKATMAIRRRKFQELSNTSTPLEALQYLQTKVHEVVDHSDPVEAEQFHTLAQYLLAGPGMFNFGAPAPTSTISPEAPAPSDTVMGSEPIVAPPSESSAPPQPGPESSPIFAVSPELGGPIGRAAGSSFPPPPSPAMNSEAFSVPLHEDSFRRGLAILSGIAEAPEPRRSYTPPPAPILQNTLPVQLPKRAVSMEPTSSTSKSPLKRTLAPQSEEPSKPPPPPFQERFKVFQAILEFVDPDEKEPEGSIVDWVTHDTHPEDVARWY